MFTTRSRKAAILTLFVLLLPVLVVMLGVCIDAAYMQLVKTELRMATDNAARVAADHFARHENKSLALREGKWMAEQFSVAGAKLKLADDDFQFGRASQSHDGAFDFDPAGSPPNAVRVIAVRAGGSQGGAVPLFFGGVIGKASFEPAATSVAAFLNVDICLVLDRSTSMKLPVNTKESGLKFTDSRFCKPPRPNTKWKALEEGVNQFLDVLMSNAVDEHVAVVTYGSDLNSVSPGLCGREREATLDLPLTSVLGDVASEVLRRSGSVWNGNTYIEAGIRLGAQELKSDGRKHAEKVLIVLTDGQPTEGDAVAAATAAKSKGIRVSTITFGDEADQAHMQAVATAGGGQHAHASDANALEEVFREFAAAATRLVQ